MRHLDRMRLEGKIGELFGPHQARRSFEAGYRSAIEDLGKVLEKLPTRKGNGIGPDKSTWDTETRARYDAALRDLDEQFRPALEAIKESETIRTGDLETRINAKG